MEQEALNITFVNAALVTATIGGFLRVGSSVFAKAFNEIHYPDEQPFKGSWIGMMVTKEQYRNTDLDL